MIEGGSRPGKQVPSTHLPDAGEELGVGTAGVPLRGIVIGSVLAFMLSYADTWATTFVHGSWMTLNFSSAAAVFVMFFFLLATLVLRLMHARFGLTQAELVTIYLMLLVACTVPGLGLVQWFLPSLVGSTYYAAPENNWDALYNQHVPDFLIPHGEEVVVSFFEGLPANAPVPWEAWVAPLAWWYGFFLILCFAMVCAMVVLRKQWVENEKLLYPLVQLPMAMLQQDHDGGHPLLRNRVMWIGFSVSFLVLSVNGLNFYHEAFPHLVRSGSVMLFDVQVPIQFNPSWLGFFYFVNRDISASIWVFYLLATLQRYLFGFLALRAEMPVDAYSGDPLLAHQCMGAMIAFVLVGLWTGRRHLRDVVRKALRTDPEVDDRDEMMSYRQALLGLVVALGLVATGMWMTGLTPPLALMFTFGAMILYLALTRVVAEGGIPAMRPAILTTSFVMSGAGTAALGTKGMVALGMTYGWHAEMRTFVMAAVANGLKVANAIRGSRRRLLWAVGLAFLLSLAASTYLTLTTAYEYGGVNLHGIFFVDGGAVIGPKDMVRFIQMERVGPQPQAWLFMGVGAVVMSGLMWARHRLLWWPLSSVGFVIGPNWKTSHIFFAALLAWLIKSLVMKYGGPKMFRGLRPFFLGLILGEFVGAGLWLVIDGVLGSVGNNLTNE